MNKTVFVYGALPFISLIAFLVTGYVLRYALSRHLIDRPNQRSSHTVPTPRGGGLAIVVVFSAALLALMFSGLLNAKFVIGLLGSGGMVAFVGWLDDRGHVAIRVRLVVQFLAAVWGLYWLEIFVFFESAGTLIQWLLYFFSLLYLVWVLNLYNFMDGINGIASIEAITVSLGMILVAGVANGGQSEPLVLWILLASVAGFLWWNFPSAKIFLGDVGSGFLGLILGLLSMAMAQVKLEFFWAWIILLGVFFVDASLTLARRVLKGERFYEAHCAHAYQHAARKYASHSRVSLACGFINLFWLLPLAILVVASVLSPFVGVLIAYLPLVAGAMYLKAGLGADS